VPNRYGVLVLASEFSDAAFVAAYNEVFDADTSRVADVKARIDEIDDLLRMTFQVVDEPIGLNIKARAEGPSPVSIYDSITIRSQLLFPVPERLFSRTRPAVQPTRVTT
jgi:hypothetical protein